MDSLPCKERRESENGKKFPIGTEKRKNSNIMMRTHCPRVKRRENNSRKEMFRWGPPLSLKKSSVKRSGTQWGSSIENSHCSNYQLLTKIGRKRKLLACWFPYVKSYLLFFLLQNWSRQFDEILVSDPHHGYSFFIMKLYQIVFIYWIKLIKTILAAWNFGEILTYDPHPIVFDQFYKRMNNK